MRKDYQLTLIGGAGLGLLSLGALLLLVPGVPPSLSSLSLVCGALALAGFFILDARQTGGGFGRRSVRYGANAALLTVMVLGILVLVNFLSSRHHRRFDLTANKRYSLSDQTMNILKGLQLKVRLVGFYKEGEGDELRDLLMEYEYHSDRIEYEFVDPDRYPGKARRYGVSTYGTLIAETDEKEEKVGGSTEEEISNALLRITRPGKKVVYILEGHGEKEIHSEEREGFSLARQAVEDDNYEVKSLLLMQEAAVPEDCSVLLVAGPQKSLLPHEEAAIDRYLRGGGKVLFLLDPAPSAGLENFLREWGVIIGSDVVVDVSGVGQLFGADEFIPIVTEFGGTDITRNFNLATFFPYARSVTRDDQARQGLTVEMLAQTSPQSWAERGQLEGSIQFDEGEDTEGPVSLAVVVTAEGDTAAAGADSTGGDGEGRKKRGARLVVFGDSDFASNAYFALSGNSDLFLNTVSYLAEEEDLIAIRPKSPDARRITLSLQESQSIFWFTVVLMPAIVLVIGLSVWWKRRR